MFIALGRRGAQRIIPPLVLPPPAQVVGKASLSLKPSGKVMISVAKYWVRK